MTRALIGALGAGTSLAVAGSAMLLIVSSVVAFHGWPNDLASTSAPQAAALWGAAPASTATRAEPLALPPARPRPHAQSTQPTSDGEVLAGDPQTAPVAEVQAATTTSAPSPGPSPTGDLQGPERASDTVRDAGDAVAVLVETVTPVVPAAGGALESVGAAGTEAVEQVGGLLP